jgi:hypothetical protein
MIALWDKWPLWGPEANFRAGAPWNKQIEEPGGHRVKAFVPASMVGEVVQHSGPCNRLPAIKVTSSISIP